MSSKAYIIVLTRTVCPTFISDQSDYITRKVMGESLQRNFQGIINITRQIIDDNTYKEP